MRHTQAIFRGELIEKTVHLGERLTKFLFAVGFMAVGDDAQSIYAFRGATVDNILDFPDLFPGTTIIKLEENYRSTQPILTLTNAILQHAGRKYEKNLFTSRTDGDKPELVRPFSDLTQAAMGDASGGRRAPPFGNPIGF